MGEDNYWRENEVELTDKLNRLMEERNMNRMDLSRATEIPYSTIASFYEKGTENVKLSTLRKLADFFGCSLDYLADDNIEEMTPSESRLMEMVSVPLVGRVSCGNGVLAFEEIEDHIETPKEWLGSGEHFYLRAKGDSMTGARIHEGDLLLIRKQEEVENGEIAAVLIGEEAVLKRVYKNGDQLILQSENPAYPPILVPPAEGRIIGKLKMATINF